MFKFTVSRPPILGQNEPLESNLAQSRESVDLALRRFHDGISREVSAYREFVTQLHNPDLDADAAWMERWAANEARRKIDQLRSRVNEWIVTPRETDSAVQALEALLSLSEWIKAEGDRHRDSQTEVWQRVMAWVRQIPYSAEEALVRRGLPTNAPVQSTRFILHSIRPIRPGCAKQSTISLGVMDGFGGSRTRAGSAGLAAMAV